MASEPDNASLDATDNAHPSEYDTPPEWDYFDPDEDQDSEAVTAEGGTEDEVEGEDLAQNEAEEAPEEADEDDGEQTTITAPENAVVQLADGSTATVKDLVAGNMRQSDYSRKTQELANARNDVQANAERIERITEAFVEHLSQMVPPEPDPSLALSDPSKFTAQKAQYDAAVAQVQKLIEIGSQPKAVQDGMSEQEKQNTLREENARLVQMFPEAGTKDGRDKFFAGAAEAAEGVGFSLQELGEVTDHRMFALAHWAQRGMAAEKAKTKAKAKVQNAPPMTPRKPGQPAKNANRNVEAMRKLNRSGSIRDAMAVDFD